METSRLRFHLGCFRLRFYACPMCFPMQGRSSNMYRRVGAWYVHTLDTHPDTSKNQVQEWKQRMAGGTYAL